MHKLKTFLYFFVLAVFISCTENSKKEEFTHLQKINGLHLSYSSVDKEIEDIDAQKKGMTISEEEILEFFSEYQMLFRKNKIDKICDRVNYPLQGDCVYYYCFGEKIFEEGFLYDDHPINRKVFHTNFHNIFSKEFIRLFTNANIEKLVSDEEYQYTIGDKSKTYYLIHMSQYENDNEDILILYISHIDKIESINEHGTTYRFKKINGEIKLFLINCIG